MTSPPFSASDTAARSDWAAIRALLPYLWPAGAWNVRARIIGVVVCMVAA